MSPHDETLIVPYLKGELTADERRGLENHLAGCADCRATTDDYRTMLGALKDGAPAPPFTFKTRPPRSPTGRQSRRTGR